MQIDASTVLLSGIFVKLLLGILFLIFWLSDRRSPWFGWWAGTYFFAMAAAAIFLIRGFEGGLSAVGTGVAALIVSFGLCWQGARSFHQRPPLWLPLEAALGLWVAACLVPGFLENLHYRVAVSSILLAALSALPAIEFWRGRDEALLSRWPVIVLFATLSVFFLCRVLFMDFLPFPLGALPMQQSAVAAFNMIVFFHALILTVLFVAVTKERLELAQRKNAQTDPLTGALNRRALMSRGAKTLVRHEYEEAPLCLLFLDLDYFKSLNDRFGHSAGDDVLTKFVGVVQESIRPSDFLFRLGGEEFCCLLPHTAIGQAQAVAERIRRQVENATADVAGVVVKITVSLGIASTETFGYDLDTLMRRADMAVYAAKRQGRNRVMVAKPEDVVGGARVVAVIGGTPLALPRQASSTS
jgi:diguanylate cyclase (GGDEF)-like protein